MQTVITGAMGSKQTLLCVLPMAMKLRFSCTLRQDTSVGLLPGIAGKILVQRGFPLSLLSRFQTFTCETRYLFQIQFSGSDTTALCFRLLWRTAHLLEGLFHVRPAPLIQGCCAASAGRGVLPATCRPEKMSTAGSASKARSCHPYVTLWGLSTVIYSWSKRCCKLDMWQFKSGHSYNNIVEYIYS